MNGHASIADSGESGSSSDIPPNYYKAKPSSFLEQGDIILRSAKVIDVTLRKYHGYHVENTANEMFAVLTQSCDLMPHQGTCKARYISLAPVRSLRSVLGREFKEFLVRTPGGLYVLGSSDTQSRYEDFLAKTINNNDSRHFFIPERPEKGIAEDMCIMLPLALSIRIEHYKDCLEGRTVQLEDLFQAKLGWLLGQQYSRVGTPDWPTEALARKVAAMSDRTLSWLPTHEFEQINAGIKEFVAANPGLELDEHALNGLRAKVQDRRELAITAVLGVLSKLDVIPAPPNPQCFKIRKELRRNPEFARFFPTS